jgi:hypothetical protein
MLDLDRRFWYIIGSGIPETGKDVLINEWIEGSHFIEERFGNFVQAFIENVLFRFGNYLLAESVIQVIDECKTMKMDIKNSTSKYLLEKSLYVFVNWICKDISNRHMVNGLFQTLIAVYEWNSLLEVGNLKVFFHELSSLKDKTIII